MIQDQVLQQITKNITKLQTSFAGMQTSFAEMKTQIITLTGIAVDTRETMKEQMVTKSEFQDGKSELFTHIDGFIKLHETLDLELVAMQKKYTRLEERIQIIEGKLGIAAI